MRCFARLRSGAAVIVLFACSCGDGRPPWADGQEIVTKVPAGRVQDRSRLPERILAIHNRERAAVAAPPLVWDENLAASAASYGPALAVRGRLVHSPQESRPAQGENLWMGTAGAFSIDEMVGGWAEERRLFVPGTVPDVSRSGHFGDVGHYTQMIWRTSARLGCALHRTRTHDFLICRYSPPGNIVGVRVP